MKTTVIVDASCIKSSACGLKLFYDVVDGYTGGHLNNDIHWGSAFHKFRAVYRETNDWFKAAKAGQDTFHSREIKVKENKKYLTVGFLNKAFIKYEERLPFYKDKLVPVIDDTGNVLIEPASRFAFPYIITDDVEIIVAGTMDEMSFQHADGFDAPAGYRIVDCKTSGSWKIREYLESYKLSTQLMMYRWAIKQYAKLHPGSIWDRIDKSPNVAGLIEGVFHRGEDTEESAAVTIARSKPIYFLPWQIEEFEVLLHRVCMNLIEHIRHFRKTGQRPMREGIINDSCSTKFGPCSYAEVCPSVDEEQRQAKLESLYIKRQYNPLQFS